MTSVLLVDTIKNSLDSADTVAFTGGIHAPGSVIQTVTKSQHGQVGTSSTSMVASGRHITITPKFADSTIIVRFYATQFIDGAAGSRHTIRRNGSDFVKEQTSENGSTSGTLKGTTGQLGFYGSGNTGWYGAGVIAVHDHDHNSTSALKYEVYLQAASGGNVYYPPGSVDHCFMEAMEIAR